MPDKTGPAVLCGFNVAVADIADRLRFCQPVLSFKGDSTLYVARKIDWGDDSKALAVTDPDEVNELGTSLPDAKQSIASGEGVVAVGAGFVQAAADAGIQLDHAEMSFLSLDDEKCRIVVATPERYKDLKERLTEEARTVFDEALGEAAHHGRPLSERGNAALFLLCTCSPRRLDDLAIRQLAGTLQNRELDLYRRLRIRFSDELDTPEDDLDKRVKCHIEATLWHTDLRLLLTHLSHLYLEDLHKISEWKIFSLDSKEDFPLEDLIAVTEGNRVLVRDVFENRRFEEVIHSLKTAEISDGKQRETLPLMNLITLPVSGKGIMDTLGGWEVS